MRPSCGVSRTCSTTDRLLGRKSKRLAQEEAWIRRGVKARTTRNEGRVAALLQLRETFKQRRTQTGVSRMQLDAAEASGEQVLKIEGLSFAYPGGETLIHDFSAKVLRGERRYHRPQRLCKTTLLDLMCGCLTPDVGSVTPAARTDRLFDRRARLI